MVPEVIIGEKTVPFSSYLNVTGGSKRQNEKEGEVSTPENER